MAYTADINIVVRGARELNQLQEKLKQTAAEIQKLDNIWKGAKSGPATLDNFNKALQEAASQLRVVKQGTDAETTAVKNYVKALNLANAARERQNKLIAQEIANQRKAVPTTDAGFGQQGPSPSRERLKSQQQLTARRKEVLSNAVIGGAFPLLFGQGIGAAVGGGLGGAAGGLAGGQFGFGLSLVGTAFGTAVDQFILQINELGKALLSTSNTLDILRERSLFSSREIERTAVKLEQAGFAATANAVAQEDLLRSIGGQGLQNLQAAGESSDRLARAFAQLAVQMQAVAAGPIATLQNRFADIVTNQALLQRASSVSGQLRQAGQGDAARRLDAQIQRIEQSPRNVFGLDPAAVQQELQAALDEASKNLPKVPVKFDAEQTRKELTNILTKQLESIDVVRGLRSQVVAQQRAQEDADRQRYELITSAERTIGDLRRSIEDRVTQQRLTNLQRENELLNVQAEARLQSVRNANIPLRNQFTNERVSSAAGAIADYLEQELQIQNQIDQQKRDTALDIQRLTIETEQYRVQVATQVARLNEDNAKRIAEINRGIRRANADQDNRRFNIEKQLAKIRLEQLEAELLRLNLEAAAYQRPDIQVSAAQAFKTVQSRIKDLQNIQAPGALREVGGVGQFGVSTAGVEAANGRATELLGNIQAARTALLDISRQGNFETLKAQLDNVFNKPLRKAIIDAQNLWNALSGQGLGARSTELAKRSGDLNELKFQLKELQLAASNPAVKDLLQGYIDNVPDLVTVSEELRVSSEILGNLNGKYIELQDQLETLRSPYGELTQVQQVRNQLVREGISLESAYAQEVLKQAGAVDVLQQQIRLATQLQQIWQGVGNAMGQAMTTGLASVVNGTQTAKEVFAQFLKSISDALLSYASQAIATYIAIGIARMFAGLGSSGGGGNPFSASPNFGGGMANSFLGNFGAGPGGLGSSISSGVSMPSFSGGIQGSLPGFAEGGLVTRPTLAMIGEGGEPEFVIPASKMDAAMTRYAAGARGASVIPSSAGSGSSPAAPGVNITYSGPMLNFNGDEYLPKSAVPELINAAARQGADMGQTRTIRTLQNSRSTRSRIGMQ